MIKKSIKRRQEGSSNTQMESDSRYKQATHSVKETYKQNKETTVYSQYYAYKRKKPIE